MKSQHIRVCMYTYVWMCYIHTYIYTRIYGVDEAPDEAPAEPEERGSPKSASTAICCRLNTQHSTNKYRQSIVVDPPR
jgi:hypothetical protein